MLALQLFLNSPRARKALRTKPGQQGFSLIELVVVIAILGILIAIALPNFLGVQKDAQINQAKNALATIVKERGVKSARFSSNTFGQPGASGEDSLVASANANLNGYTLTTGDDITATAGGSETALALGSSTAAGTNTNDSCYEVQAFASDGKLPHFAIEFSPTTGETTKTCYVEKTDTYVAGCDGATAGTVGAGTW